MIAGAGAALSRVLFGAMAFSLMLLGGCSDSGGDGGAISGTCVPLETRECKALTGCSGVQQCSADGLSFSQCVCSSLATGGASGSAGTGNISGSGGAQSQAGSGGSEAQAGAGTGGSSGAGGSSPEGGTGNAAGSSNAGTGGVSGNAGAGGNGTEAGGSAGVGGNAGAGGTPSAGGASGNGGTPGAGGASGSSGSGGTSGSSGSGGNAGAAGNGGTGGAPQVGCKTPEVIDDFEDGDDMPCVHDGRAGKWRLDHDTSPAGQQTPDPFLPSADTSTSSKFAGFTKGSGFAVWGGGLSVTLRQELASGAMRAYDASKYAGITFRAKAKTALRMSAGFETVQTLPTSDGGTCQDTCGSGTPEPGCTRCYEPFRKVIDVGTAWKTYHVPFAHLRQGTATPQTFDARQLMYLSFIAVASTFEFSVDDIAFYNGQPVEFGCDDPKIVDDFEDGDTRICSHDGRVGLAANSNDGRGTQQPNPFSSSVEMRPGDGSEFAAHTTGSGFDRWGGGIFFNLNQPLVGDATKAYNATKYAGFSFDAMSSTLSDVLVGFQTTQTVSTEFGGQCLQTCTEENPVDCTECFLPFQKIVRLGPGWQRYYVSFAQLQQIIDTEQTFDASELMTMLFTSPDPSFDFWVDNVRFYSPGEVKIGCASPAIIDDFEDGDAEPCEHDGRKGVWAVDNDNTGSQWPLPLLPQFDPRATSQYSLITLGSGFEVWGGGVSVGFNKPGLSELLLPYDARKYQGIKLMARASQPTTLLVGFQTTQTVTSELGGECVACNPELSDCEPCYNGFSQDVSVTNSWKEYTVPFSSLSQLVSTSQTFEEDELLYMTIVVTQPTFDFSIDDLRFY